MYLCLSVHMYVCACVFLYVCACVCMYICVHWNTVAWTQVSWRHGEQTSVTFCPLDSNWVCICSVVRWGTVTPSPAQSPQDLGVLLPSPIAPYVLFWRPSILFWNKSGRGIRARSLWEQERHLTQGTAPLSLQGCFHGQRSHLRFPGKPLWEPGWSKAGHPSIPVCCCCCFSSLTGKQILLQRNWLAPQAESSRCGKHLSMNKNYTANKQTPNKRWRQ